MWSRWTLGHIEFKPLLVPLWDLCEGERVAPSWSINHNELPAFHHFMPHFRLSGSGSATLKPSLSQYGVARQTLASPSSTNEDQSDLRQGDALFLP